MYLVLHSLRQIAVRQTVGLAYIARPANRREVASTVSGCSPTGNVNSSCHLREQLSESVAVAKKCPFQGPMS